MNNGIEGDVQSRMDAFRGNPQALAQRYAQNQQLIDLLALQKLKSEKDAAARQMQMQAGQGQMPTIAQQREQELMGMAKQDVAQRVGAVGQQQAQQQQKNLQQAMQGGIAQAPAPNMMPAQAMASGGIVAFAEGGDTGDTDNEPRLPGESDEAYLERVGSSPFTRELKRLGKSAMGMLTAPSPIQNEEYARLMDLERNVLPQYSRGMFSRMTPEQAQAEQAVQNFYRQNKEQIVREPGLYEAFKRDPVGVAYGRTSTQREAVGKVAAPTDTSYAAAEEARARARQQMVGQAQAAPAQAAPAQAAPAQAAPSPAFAQQDQSYASKEARGMAAPSQPEAPVGAFQGDPQQIEAQLAAIKDPTERAAATAAYARQRAAGGAPAQGIAQAAQQAAQQPSGVQAGLEKYLSGALGADLSAAGIAGEAEHDKRYGALYKQQQELSQQGIAQLQQRMAQQPKQDPLTEFLRGMSSQRTLGMALGAGSAGMNASQRENFKQQAELEDQLQKMRELGLGAQVTQATAQQAANEARRKEALGLGEKAATAATNLVTGLASSDARQLAAQAQAEARERVAALNLDEKTKAAYANAVKAQTDSVIKEMGALILSAKGKQDFEVKKKQIREDTAKLFGIPLPSEEPAPAAGAPTGQKNISVKY
jgi:hypothetical protein